MAGSRLNLIPGGLPRSYLERVPMPTLYNGTGYAPVPAVNRQPHPQQGVSALDGPPAGSGSGSGKGGHASAKNSNANRGTLFFHTSVINPPRQSTTTLAKARWTIHISHSFVNDLVTLPSCKSFLRKGPPVNSGIYLLIYHTVCH